LKKLRIGGNPKLKEYKELECLKSLERLFIFSNKITDFKDLPKIDSLLQLDLDNNDIESLENMYQYPKLSTLQMRNNGIKKGVTALNGLVNLEKFVAMQNDISDEDLKDWKPNDNLKTLLFFENKNIKSLDWLYTNEKELKFKNLIQLGLDLKDHDLSVFIKKV
jgi:Leucine-rich repeat (LRR) protein